MGAWGSSVPWSGRKRWWLEGLWHPPPHSSGFDKSAASESLQDPASVHEAGEARALPWAGLSWSSVPPSIGASS